MFKREFEYSEPPKTLCPYFWITLALCIITPLQMLFRGFDSIMKKIVSAFPKKAKVEKTMDEWEIEYKEQRQKQKIKQARMEKIGKFFGKVFMYGVAPILLIILVYGMFKEFQKLGWYHTLAGLGICIVIAIFIVAIYTLIGFLFDRYSTKVGNAITKFSVFIFTPLKWIGWMIKAGYEKACPLVEWEGDTDVKKELP
jgi:hypothetical protein